MNQTVRSPGQEFRVWRFALSLQSVDNGVLLFWQVSILLPLLVSR